MPRVPESALEPPVGGEEGSQGSILTSPYLGTSVPSGLRLRPGSLLLPLSIGQLPSVNLPQSPVGTKGHSHGRADHAQHLLSPTELPSPASPPGVLLLHQGKTPASVVTFQVLAISKYRITNISISPPNFLMYCPPIPRKPTADLLSP